MKGWVTLLLLCLLSASAAMAQDDLVREGEDPMRTPERRKRITSDSIQSQHKIVPRGLKTWTVDSRFGEIREVEPDTLSYLFMNSAQTIGTYGDYNTTGNVGSPRISRIFSHREEGSHFMFTDPYSFFITRPEDLHFTQTLSPLTNLSYFTCGDRTNGEDQLHAKFAVNAGRKLGVGMKFDYLYGRGYFQYQNTSLLGYTLYASYRGERYGAHFIASLGHQKVAENGGVADDNYITHPDSYAEDFNEDEIPTVLTQNWNRNDHQHIFFTHRYNVGFSRQVPLTEEERQARRFAIESKRVNEESRAREEAEREARESGREFDEREYQRRRQTTVEEPSDTAWTKIEYVPVTSFVHTLQFHNYRRIYQAYKTPTDFYAEQYYDAGRLTGDSIYDKTRHYELSNTFAIALLEGFQKWAKAGLKAFVTHDLRHFALPDIEGRYSTINEHGLMVGGMLSKRQGKAFHYDITASVGVAGDDSGELSIDANADVNIPFLRDTLRISTGAFFHRTQPTFYMRNYHSRHFWWDKAAEDMTNHSRISARLDYRPTDTRLSFALDRIGNYTYLLHNYTLNEDHTHTANAVSVEQHKEQITVMMLQLGQNFRLGPLHFDNVFTLQTSSEEKILAVPAFNLYSNLYVRFRIAKVLHCDFGADVRYFTKYYAPSYIPMMGQFGVGTVTVSDQDGIRRIQEKVGGHPYVNVYANFFLKHTRFFVMLSHVNSDMGNRSYFLTPHYPQNSRTLHFGLSWNFFN